MRLRLSISIALALSVVGGSYATRAQVSKPVKIGVLSDFQGIFADASGTGSVVATELAIADYKAQGGTLPVELIQGDYQNKPDIGAGIARRWFDVDGVDMIVDVANSSVALAVSDLAKDRNKVFLATGATSTEITGPRCSPNTIQWFDNYMLSSAITQALLKEGKKKFFFVTADYAFGSDIQGLARKMIEDKGGKFVGGVKHPIGSMDYSSFLIAAGASDADVIAMANAGGDVVNSIKQAHEFQLTQSGKVLAAFVATALTVKAIGLEAAKNLFVTEAFYWNTDDKTRAFSDRFFQRMNKMPNFVQAGAYSATLRYLQARETLKASQDAGADGQKVIGEMKSKSFDDPLFGATTIRKDGRALHRTYLFQVKTVAADARGWDIFNKIGEISGEDSALPLRPDVCPIAK